VAEAIRAAHRGLERGEPVYRWQGPKTSFAEPGDLIFPEPHTDQPRLGAESVELADRPGQDLMPLRPGRAALLWDKSFLWGYMAVSLLRALGFPFELITAAAVRNGSLNACDLLVVPGGWASLKNQELGSVGRSELRRYVRGGGSYLGLCGGVGLALQVDEGLGLLPAGRKPMTHRLPNFSGSIRVRRTTTHPLWWGLKDEASFQVWWPSQFQLYRPGTIRVLGRYGQPESDFRVSDLNVQDTQAAGLDWQRLEQAYEINLDPERLVDEPAIVEGQYGRGRVLLSYPHLETPGDTSGNLALFNVWHYLLGASASPVHTTVQSASSLPGAEPVDDASLDRVQRLAGEAEELVALGESRRLWSWRNSWLLQWRRGIRGAEFGTICVLLRGLARELDRARISRGAPHAAPTHPAPRSIRRLEKLWRSFLPQSRVLLWLEEEALQKKAAGTEGGCRRRVRALRTELFGCVNCYGSKSYGGLYRALLDELDRLLLQALMTNLG
jgi:hypothetical protein